MSGNNLTKTVYIPTALKKQETPVVSTSAAQENTKAQVRFIILRDAYIILLYRLL